MGQQALLAGDWLAARDAFLEAEVEAEGTGPSADVLDGLGVALWWLSDPRAGLTARGRAYALLRAEGRLAEAGRVAVWLAREHRNLLRNDAVADGWLARARGLREEDGSLSGWLHLADAEAAGRASDALALADAAVAAARRHGQPDLEILALARRGTLRVSVADVAGGLRDLNEAMVAATAGEGPDPQCVGEALCLLMEAATLLGDLSTVSDWAGVLVESGSVRDLGPLLPGIGALDVVDAYCGACCCGIYLVSGRVDQAEGLMVAGVERWRSDGLHPRCVHPVAQLAGLRLVQGRLEEAGVLLEGHEDLADCIPVAARLDLVRGWPGAAVARLRTGLDRVRDQPVRALPLLVLLVDAALADGQPEIARHAAQELARTAQATGATKHRALASYAAGRLAVGDGDPAGLGHLRAAVRGFAESSDALMACRTRLTMARALADHDRASAIVEARSALRALDRIGATADADQAAGFLGELGVTGRTGPRDLGVLTRREQEVLRLVAAGMTNVEIAERLVISVKTAGNHVSNILTKLGLRSRTEAATFAVLHLGVPGAAPLP